MSNDENTTPIGDENFGRPGADEADGMTRPTSPAGSAAAAAAARAAYAEAGKQAPAADPTGATAADAASPTAAEAPAPEADNADTTAPADASALDSDAAALAAERLVDLQRLNAEYTNYRRRVERERGEDRIRITGSVVESMLPVLDEIHLAREHGDLAEGTPFAKIAEKLEGILAGHGVERFGAVGETFDPTIHEALMHTTADLPEGTTDTTVVMVMQPGYRIGERVVRPARVSVADPA